MNVYITTFDEKLEKTVELILELFSKDKGEINFKPLKMDKDFYYMRQYSDKENIEYYEIAKLGENVKNFYQIDRDYLVIVTSKKILIPTTKSLNEKDWNSAFIHKTIIVKSTGFEKLTDERPYLGIAHQVIENLFQSLSKMVIYSPNLYRTIHLESEGCINDYCKDFKDIKTKIMSGRICKSCQQRAVDQNVSPVTMKQIKDILQRINMIINDNFDYEDDKITIEPHGRVFIGNTKIDFGKRTVTKIVYLFFLINYNNIIYRDDIMYDEEIREKFIQLGFLFDVDYDKKENDAEYVRLNKLIVKLSPHITKIKDDLKNYAFNENLKKTLFIQSKYNSDNHHYYQIEIPDEQGIEIHKSMLEYRVDKV